MQQASSRHLAQSITTLALLCTVGVHAATNDDDADALALPGAPVQSTREASTTRLFVEGAVGAVQPDSQAGWRGQERASIDLSTSFRLAPQWRAVLSDRLDATHPAGFGEEPTVNSLREAYVSWQQADGATLVDLGRVNLRYGPAYGYNPTDFLRDNTLRTITTANPLSLREDRLGTFMLRGQHLWGESALSIAYAPKLANGPSSQGESIDAGATNNRDRALVSFSRRLTDRVGTQFLAYKESRQSVQWGASMTALLADSAVAYAEASRGKAPDLLGVSMGLDQPKTSRNRLAAGVTFTPIPKLSLTGEYEYNGFALDRAGWNNVLRAGPAAVSGYLLQSVNLQELASRQAWLAFATLKDAGARNLDLTALLRVNATDHSRLGWLELRYHWPTVDLALQLQQQGGGRMTEYGLLPYYRSIQVLASYRFL